MINQPTNPHIFGMWQESEENPDIHRQTPHTSPEVNTEPKWLVLQGSTITSCAIVSQCFQQQPG